MQDKVHGKTSDPAKSVPDCHHISPLNPSARESSPLGFFSLSNETGPRQCHPIPSYSLFFKSWRFRGPPKKNIIKIVQVAVVVLWLRIFLDGNGGIEDVVGRFLKKIVPVAIRMACIKLSDVGSGVSDRKYLCDFVKRVSVKVPSANNE